MCMCVGRGTMGKHTVSVPRELGPGSAQSRSKNMNLESQTKLQRRLWLQHLRSATLGAS